MRPHLRTIIALASSVALGGCLQATKPTHAPLQATRQGAAQYGRGHPWVEPKFFAMDMWPTWSQDGRWIAYTRLWPSTDGPAGIYMVPFAGGSPKLVAANISGRDASFSRDDSKLACLSGYLRVVEVATGAVTTPFFTDNGVAYPSWSVDGKRLAYTRTHRNYDEPFDSAGIHVFSFVTGRDEVLRLNGEVVNGSWPQWSPDGSLFAYLGNHPSGKTAIYVLTPDSVQHAVAVATGWWFERFQWIQTNPNDTRLLILERTFQNENVWRVVRSDGIRVGDSPMRLGFEGAASPDGRWGVARRGQPGDSIGVLFLENAQGKIARQLTFYEPGPVVSQRLTDEVR